jgi:hypothetical protein
MLGTNAKSSFAFFNFKKFVTTQVPFGEVSLSEPYSCCRRRKSLAGGLSDDASFRRARLPFGQAPTH